MADRLIRQPNTAPEDGYPPIEPFDHGMLDVGDGHRIYWEQSGNPDGVPVVFLHGGPGAGAVAAHRRFFDPDFYRIVVFDQRGCGRSRPLAETRANTTQHLIDDMETIRERTGIGRWLVFGGSWGSFLALAYGIAHPERCLGFVLRGVFLGGESEVDWFLHGMGRFFPDAGRAFAEFLPEDERGDLLGNYHRRLMDPDKKVHGPAAAAWSRYETACSRLVPPGGGGGAGAGALTLARLEAHYFVNRFFVPDGHLLDELGAIAHLPAEIVQGRYDVICPPATADRLARAWPGATLTIVDDAGHSAFEPGIRAHLVRATDRLRERLSPTG